MATVLSRRGLRIIATNALVAFGLISGVLQFVGQVFDPKISAPWLSTAGIAAGCLTWGILRARPRRHIRREFDRPEMVIEVKVGDLFDEQAHLVAGFSDTFDTDTALDLVINSKTVQGQLLARVYEGDTNRLDQELTEALAGVEVVSTSSRDVKRAGKLDRYPVGTVATVGTSRRRVFAVAYSHMGDDLVAKSSVNLLWHSLGKLWDTVYQRAQRERVAIPLVGSELARINCLDRESLLKMILLSFVARSREELICRELTVVIHPRDHQKIDMLEMDAFLRTL